MSILNTKDQRIKLRQSSIDRDIKSGFKREDFKDAIILTNSTPNEKGKFYAKHYTGTKSSPDKYFSFSSLDALNEYILRLKKNISSRVEWKEKRKKEGKRLTPAARASKMIKENLKNKFPGVKFSVKSSNFSMGDSVSVSWVNGPTEKEIKDIINIYQYGSFNSYEDMYENTNRREDIPQTKYVSTSREISEDLKKMFSDIYQEPTNAPHNDAQRSMYNFFQNNSIPHKAENLKIVENTEIKSGFSYEFYKLSYTLKEDLKKEDSKIEKIEVEKGKINVIEYSKKSIAVIGDTKPLKDKLKSIGGKFNFRLSCGPGWIFPLSKLEDVKNVLSKDDKKKEPETTILKVVKDEEINIFNTFTDLKKAVNKGEQISLFNLAQLN